MNRRKKHFAKLKAEEIRRKPPTKAQKRNQMSTYLKNMARFKHSQLKSKSYDEIQKLFDKEMKRVNTFMYMNSEVVKGSETRTEESSKRAGDELKFDKSMKQKIDEHVEAEKDNDPEEEEMKKHMEIVQDEKEIAIDAIPLATKPPMIVEYKIVKEGQKGFYHLIRADGSSKRYSSMIRMLQGVIHITSVNRPQLRSTQMKDKVVQNNSQVKIIQKEVEDHHRISSLSNKTKNTRDLGSFGEETEQDYNSTPNLMKKMRIMARDGVTITCNGVGTCKGRRRNSDDGVRSNRLKEALEDMAGRQPEQTLEDEFNDLHLNLPVLEVLAHAPIYNAILDKYVKSLELGKNRSTFIQGKMPEKMKDPELFTLPCRLGDSKPFDTLADLGSCVNLIPLYLFKKLKIGLLEETDHVFGLADETKSYPDLLNDFMNPPDELVTDDSESDTESYETPLVSPFLDSDDESDDGEVINELNEYGNAGNFHRNRIINSFDGNDLAFPCMISLTKFGAYFDPLLPMNIITLTYNTIMVEGLQSMGGNLVAIVRDVYVFVGSFTYITDFMVLEDIGEFIISDMTDVVIGGLKYSHEKNKFMYKNCLNLDPEYQVDESMREWLIHGHVSLHEVT
ncbi:hypothetical protein Tco_0584220 [Tanacetum coccineum]